jgi:hypothetical protein
VTPEEKRESHRLAQRRYRERNREQELERAKRYREVNREKELARQRRYREAHREELTEEKRRWRRENPEKKKAQNDARIFAGKMYVGTVRFTDQEKERMLNGSPD